MRVRPIGKLYGRCCGIHRIVGSTVGKLRIRGNHPHCIIRGNFSRSQCGPHTRKMPRVA